MKAASDREAVGVAAVDYLAFGGLVTLASHWLKMEQVIRIIPPYSINTGAQDGAGLSMNSFNNELKMQG